jgi:hypothetical protein
MVQAPLRKGFELSAAFQWIRQREAFLIWINFARRTCFYDEIKITAWSAARPGAEEAMPIGQRLLYLSVLLFASVAAIDAHAGVTISDRRYWPSEARGSAGQLIEIYPRQYIAPEANVIAGSRTTPRKKARPNR